MKLTPPTDTELAEIIRDEPWFREVTCLRVEDELNQLRRAMDAFDALRGRIAAKAIRLLSELPVAMGYGDLQERKNALNDIAGTAVGLRDELSQELRTFERRSYRTYLPGERVTDLCGDGISTLTSSLVRRFETVVHKDADDCIKIIRSIPARCEDAIQKINTRRRKTL